MCKLNTLNTVVLISLLFASWGLLAQPASGDCLVLGTPRSANERLEAMVLETPFRANPEEDWDPDEVNQEVDGATGRRGSGEGAPFVVESAEPGSAASSFPGLGVQGGNGGSRPASVFTPAGVRGATPESYPGRELRLEPLGPADRSSAGGSQASATPQVRTFGVPHVVSIDHLDAASTPSSVPSDVYAIPSGACRKLKCTE